MKYHDLEHEVRDRRFGRLMATVVNLVAKEGSQLKTEDDYIPKKQVVQALKNDPRPKTYAERAARNKEVRGQVDNVMQTIMSGRMS